jgi:hypothetical protein
MAYSGKHQRGFQENMGVVEEEAEEGVLSLKTEIPVLSN